MTGPHPDPLDPIQNLEPAAVAAHREHLQAMVEMSKAISLKRVADVLESMNASGMANKLSEACFWAGDSFARGMEHGKPRG